MKKIIYSAAAMAIVLSGCSTKEAPPETTLANENTVASGEATVIGTGSGYGGAMEVEVLFDGATIKDFNVVSGNESSLIEKRALPILKERVLEAQSPVVDSVSGATFTSFGIKKAIAEAAKQQGIQVEEITMTTAAPAKERQDLEAVNTSLLVVGGGPAGLAAAISAKEAGVEEVIVIEKLDILSGNGKFDMNFYDLINSQAQQEAGIEVTVEQFIEGKQGTIDTPERLQVWAEGSAQIDEWFRGMGIELNKSNGGTNHMAEADAYAGEEIQDGMEARVQELGIDVRTGTKGYNLIMDGNKVTGVKVENKNNYYDIMADAVIIATGGFSHNKELLEKYAPGTERVATSNQMGATGDFVSVFEEHGMMLDHMSNIRVFKTILKPRRDLTGASDGYILVNENGERFIDERKGEMEMANAMLDQPNSKVYYVYDQNHYDSSYRLKKHNEAGYHIKADTLEELAEKIGVPVQALTETVDVYNKAINGEMADPFRDEPYQTPFNVEGPFYAAQVESGVHMTKGGVVANEKAQVLNTAGEVVEGLYAAGEVTDISGGYNASVVFGKVSGEEAAKALLK